MSNENAKRRVGPQPSFVWFLGFVGALIYYIQQATGFWMGVLGFVKAIVWPAFLTYKLFDFLKL